MSQPRGYMRLVFPAVEVPATAALRPPSPEDAAALAALMMSAYVGTIDYEGESEADALIEVRRTLSGDRGPFLWSASRVIEREGKLASASLVIRWKEQPLVAFAMTAAPFKRRGLARACLLGSIHHLQANAERELGLFVTLANHDASRLYESLGFRLQQ